MPSWTKKPVVRAVIWATIIVALGAILFHFDAAETVGVWVLLPGVLAEFTRIKIGWSDFPIGDSWLIPTCLGVSWLFYFGVSYPLFRWRARRKASRDSAPAHTP
jgi:hypothetical protein